MIKLKLARLDYNLLVSSSRNQLAEYFCSDKIFCSTLNSLTLGYTATSPCLHFHFDADQVLKMNSNCGLVTLVTPQKRGSKLKKFQKF